MVVFHLSANSSAWETTLTRCSFCERFPYKAAVWTRILCPCGVPVGMEVCHNSEKAAGLWCRGAEWPRSDNNNNNTEICFRSLSKNTSVHTDCDWQTVRQLCVNAAHTVEQKEQMASTCQVECFVRLMWSKSRERGESPTQIKNSQQIGAEPDEGVHLENGTCLRRAKMKTACSFKCLLQPAYVWGTTSRPPAPGYCSCPILLAGCQLPGWIWKSVSHV